MKNPVLGGVFSSKSYLSVHIARNKAIHFAWNVLHLLKQFTRPCQFLDVVAAFSIAHLLAEAGFSACTANRLQLDKSQFVGHWFDCVVEVCSSDAHTITENAI